MYRKAGNFSLFGGKGLAPREVFDHSVFAIPKPYPDAQLLLERRHVPRNVLAAGQFFQLNLYTSEFYGLPRDLICVFHDIEENVDAPVSTAECCENLAHMLKVERDRGVDSTYNILGILFDCKRDQILTSNNRHSIAFHSFNHDLGDLRQLPQCREVDLRVRGYRPPKSRITPKLTDYNLTFFNFEWLACSLQSIGSSEFVARNGIISVPIHMDDFPLFIGVKRYDQWETKLLELAGTRRFLGLGVHDCYAGLWLRHYHTLLDKFQALERLVNADETCNRAFLYGPSGRESEFNHVFNHSSVSSP
jgi:hypothetical protein